MIRAARSGGAVIQKYFGQTLARKVKKDASDYQTRADLESERLIVRHLRRSFPGFAITGEEETRVRGDGPYRFIIDPLDGTNNFVLGIPYVGVSIGLLRGHKLIAGVVYDVFKRQMYHAAAGGGTWCDGRRLRVAQTRSIRQVTVGLTNDYVVSRVGHIQRYEALYRLGVKRVTVNWSPALDICSVAAGRSEAMVVHGNQLYDFAAAKLIAREAGAIITNLQGKPERRETTSNFLISCGTSIHRELVRVLKK